MVSAGRLDALVEVQAKSVTRDTFGAEVITWDAVATLWAEVFEQRATEVVAANRDAQERTVVFRVRDGFAVTTAMRLSWNGDLYSVRGVTAPPRRGELMIEARHITGGDAR